MRREIGSMHFAVLALLRCPDGVRAGRPPSAGWWQLFYQMVSTLVLRRRPGQFSKTYPLACARMVRANA